jgi:MtN3 and saliva related transmembrane protein
MSVELVPTLGFLAGALTTLSLIPQVVHVLRRRSAHDISLLFTLLFLVGVVVWLIYGIMDKLSPVILWNAVATVLAGLLLWAKLKHGRS